MFECNTAPSGVVFSGVSSPSFGGVEPSFEELEEIEASSHVTDAEIAAIDAESNLISAIDRFAKARAKVWALRFDAEAAA